ncbi:FadR/GntR family transcriptional regulator [Acrocarpospora phusangensis]|nr:FCD domain-containing protein [Acrocarpospora phusangensis]
MSEGSAESTSALLRPIRMGNSFEETVERLLQMIHLGVYAPGESLPPERELARRFGVSRDTVRDAIRSLGEAGYLVTLRGRYGGTFLAKTLPKAPQPEGGQLPDLDIDDLLTVRELLEVATVRVAARRALTATERDTLWTRLTDVQAADCENYRRLDSRLHLTIAELVGSPSVTAMVADNRMLVNQILDRMPLLERNIVNSNEQHHAIVLAILTGDKERAVQAMEEHLAGTVALIHGFLGASPSRRAPLLPDDDL